MTDQAAPLTQESERKRLAVALARYLSEGPGTFRHLLGYLGIDYATAYREGWMGFNNALVAFEDAIEAAAARRERESLLAGFDEAAKCHDADRRAIEGSGVVEALAMVTDALDVWVEGSHRVAGGRCPHRDDGPCTSHRVVAEARRILAALPRPEEPRVECPERMAGHIPGEDGHCLLCGYAPEKPRVERCACACVCHRDGGGECISCSIGKHTLDAMRGLPRPEAPQ